MREELKPVLEIVNRIRGARGMEALTELPKGIPKDCYQCVIARAVAKEDEKGVLASSYLIEFHHAAEDVARIGAAIGEAVRRHGHNDQPFGVKTPRVLFIFISDFDHFKYPDLVAES